MLYQMIGGATPWAEEQMRLAEIAAPPRPLPSLAEQRRGVPPDLEALVRRSLAWQAAERPTARELADALERLADHLDDGPTDRVLSTVGNFEPTVLPPFPRRGRGDAERVAAG
jgi:hypothetical protein